jgi:hypothetical protein
MLTSGRGQDFCSNCEQIQMYSLYSHYEQKGKQTLKRHSTPPTPLLLPCGLYSRNKLYFGDSSNIYAEPITHAC